MNKKKVRVIFFSNLYFAVADSQQSEKKLIHKNCSQSSAEIIKNVGLHIYK